MRFWLMVRNPRSFHYNFWLSSIVPLFNAVYLGNSGFSLSCGTGGPVPALRLRSRSLKPTGWSSCVVFLNLPPRLRIQSSPSPASAPSQYLGEPLSMTRPSLPFQPLPSSLPSLLLHPLPAYVISSLPKYYNPNPRVNLAP